MIDLWTAIDYFIDCYEFQTVSNIGRKQVKDQGIYTRLVDYPQTKGLKKIGKLTMEK